MSSPVLQKGFQALYGPSSTLADGAGCEVGLNVGAVWYNCPMQSTARSVKGGKVRPSVATSSTGEGESSASKGWFGWRY